MGLFQGLFRVYSYYDDRRSIAKNPHVINLSVKALEDAFAPGGTFDLHDENCIKNILLSTYNTWGKRTIYDSVILQETEDKLRA